MVPLFPGPAAQRRGWREAAPDHALSALLFCRQVKDQNKKVANLKHKEQVEKKKSAQMLEEARRREDNLNDSSQQLQVTWELN